MQRVDARGRQKQISLVSFFLLSLLRFYKRFLSPLLIPSCRFTPTCSEYAYEAIRRYGSVRGSWLSIKRLCRCNPFCRGGYDPVQ